MGFHECLESVSGEAISKLLLSAFEALGLDMDYCTGQSYDGSRLVNNRYTVWGLYYW